MVDMAAQDAEVIYNPDTYVRGVPYQALARLRRDSPVVWMAEPPIDPWPGGPGFWAVLRHADVRRGRWRGWSPASAGAPALWSTRWSTVARPTSPRRSPRTCRC